jgi:hypothetical protein
LSQYPYFPPPYLPPTPDGYWQPSSRGSAAASTAGILQMVLAGITLLFGTCFGTLLMSSGAETFINEMQQRGMELPNIPGENVVDVVRIILVVFTVAAMLFGTILLVLAVFVRQGKKSAIITSLIFVGIVTLFLTANFISGIVQMNPGVIVIAIGLALAVMTFVKLFQAMQAGPDPQMADAMRQAWMWMMQQQSAGGYGYGYGPEPQAPAAPPMPPPNQNPPTST